MTAITAEQRREWGRQGGRARAAMPDFREHQSRAGKRSAERNDMAALGHKGAMVVIERYGYARLWRLAREWRIGHPSAPERQVMALLDGLGCAGRYEREVEIEAGGPFCSVDFLVDGRLVVEVNGKVHCDPLFDRPNRPATRAASDRERVRKLERAGYRVLVVDYRDLGRRDLAATRQRLAEFLEV